MKRLWLWVFLFCLSGYAVAQNSTADQQASCNASFHEGCKSDQTSTTTTSSGFAAPTGVLGSSGLESALVALLIAGGHRPQALPLPGRRRAETRIPQACRAA